MDWARRGDVSDEDDEIVYLEHNRTHQHQYHLEEWTNDIPSQQLFPSQLSQELPSISKLMPRKERRKRRRQPSLYEHHFEEQDEYDNTMEEEEEDREGPAEEEDIFASLYSCLGRMEEGGKDGDEVMDQMDESETTYSKPKENMSSPRDIQETHEPADMPASVADKDESRASEQDEVQIDVGEHERMTLAGDPVMKSTADGVTVETEATEVTLHPPSNPGEPGNDKARDQSYPAAPSRRLPADYDESPTSQMYLEQRLRKPRRTKLHQMQTQVEFSFSQEMNDELVIGLARQRQRAVTSSRPVTRGGGRPTNNSLAKKKPASTAMVRTSKSIVGQRPQHWGMSQSSMLPRRNAGESGLVFAKTDRASRAAALSQATRTRAFLSSRSRANVSGQNQRSLNKRQTKPPSASEKALKEAHDNLSQRSSVKWGPDAKVRNMSFTPAFVSSSSGTASQEELDGDENQLMDANTQSMSSTQPRTPMTEYMLYGLDPGISAGSSGGTAGQKRPAKKTSTHPAGGPLVRQLRAIRGSVEGDWVRLQSGMYPYRGEPSKGRGKNVNDPRNRAHSQMDVTFLEESVPWECGHRRVTVRGWIHSHVSLKGEKCNAPAAGNDAPGEAWICFTFESALEQKVARGIHLRIYNAIVISSSSSDGNTLPTVIGTQLCEPYPAVLPPLPDVCHTMLQSRT